MHVRADTDEIENVTLIDCPADRTVRLAVPLRVWNMRRDCFQQTFIGWYGDVLGLY